MWKINFANILIVSDSIQAKTAVETMGNTTSISTKVLRYFGEKRVALSR